MSQLKESKHLYIPLKDIEIATKHFEECIGRGGYGRVYKGELFVSGKHTTVAVKRLNENLGQGLKEFLTEIQLLSGHTHPNLISLLGYCDQGNERIIVYEYAKRGSLDRYIRRSNTTHTLTWMERLKICADAARGLEFLHYHVGKNQAIIHRDMKSANVLIDQNMVAKISDLGLSKLSLAGLNRSAVISHACGTPGYCEPEYIITGIVKKESDVYSFGMILFEVLCGRLCNVIDHDGFLLSAKLIKDYYEKNKLDEIVDPALKDQMSSNSLKKFSAIAYGCLSDDREQRPSMNVVLKELEELVKIQHYSELPDIEHVIVNAHAIDPQSLVELFGTLSPERALECMKVLLLVNLRGNLQIVVQVANKYSERLGVESCIKLFENFKSYEGLYLFLGSYLSSSEDPDIHFKYIVVAAKTGQIKEVERVTRESNFYDAEKTKKFLIEAKLSDVRPLINVCDRFGFVPDLTHYFYTNDMLPYIEIYVQKVSPGNAPLVVGQLLDDECPEDFIKHLILSVRSLLPVEPLVDECEKRNRLRFLTQFLEHLVSEGSQDVHVHNALGKIIIDSKNNPKHFLITNQYYDSHVVGKYCKTRDPMLAVVAYRRGLCDDELLDVTNKNFLFMLQARYVVERMDGDLWEKVLNTENKYRRQLIDQVVSAALPESKSPLQVSAAIKAFMNADLPHELIKLLEKVVLQNSAFSGNFNLQNLLILTAIKVDRPRVMDFVKRLDNFDGPAVGEVAVEAQLYEEAFAIFKKFNLNVKAVNVLLDHIQSIPLAVDFASRVEEDAVWSQVAKARSKGQLR